MGLETCPSRRETTIAERATVWAYYEVLAWEDFIPDSRSCRPTPLYRL